MSEYHISIFSLRLQISFLLQFVVQLDGWDQRSRGFLLFVGKENGLVKSKYLLLNFHYLAAYQQACNVCIAHRGICTRKLVCLGSLGDNTSLYYLASESRKTIVDTTRLHSARRCRRTAPPCSPWSGPTSSQCCSIVNSVTYIGKIAVLQLSRVDLLMVDNTRSGVGSFVGDGSIFGAVEVSILITFMCYEIKD